MNISVVIPLYNKENAIVKTLQSVFDQTISDFEVVVVDDGSTDNSLEVVRAIRDARIRVIHKENGGVSSARNVGIKAAKGQYVALLDGDDLWQPNGLLAVLLESVAQIKSGALVREDHRQFLL